MPDDSNNVTSFRWQLDDFRKQRRDAYEIDKSLKSSAFSLNSSCQAVQFMLMYKATKFLWSDMFGIILKKTDCNQSIETNLKLWFEDESGHKFGEYFVQNYVFDEVDSKCKFGVNYTGSTYDHLFNLWDKHEALFICCELTDLKEQEVPVSHSTQKFHQNIWSLYEQGMYDTIIKVGDKKTEFKILKFLFIAQSDVFKQMFSPNFRENQTNEVEISDIDEKSTLQLIRWFYTGKIDDESYADQLFPISDKYNIQLLKDTCVGLMLKSLDKSNAFMRLTLSVMHSNDRLKKATLECIGCMSKIELGNCFMSLDWIEFLGKNRLAADEVMKLVREQLNE